MSALAEIQEIERLREPLEGLARFEVLARSGDEGFPIYKISFGSEDPSAPVLGLVGGVHGLERIGAQVCVSLLGSLSQLALWDHNTQETLKKIRVFFIPTVNPVGILLRRRSNPRGVDLMRNAPVEAEGRTTFLVGGQRLSPWLPWYRGETSGLELESRALVDGVESELAGSRLCLCVDFHSGFGLQDRIWFPYAKSSEPYPDLPLAHSFTELMERTYPHHFYKIEPQSLNYTTHGDLWDYIYDRHRGVGRTSPFLPLAVEMGSWNWVRKNPFQFFSVDGSFNPVKRHRLQRTLRRHNTLFEFLIRAVSSPEAWASLNAEQTEKHRLRALQRWYGHD